MTVKGTIPGYYTSRRSPFGSIEDSESLPSVRPPRKDNGYFINTISININTSNVMNSAVVKHVRT